MVRVYDVGEWRGRLYIAMEKIDGPWAGDLLRKHGALPWREAARIVHEATCGLAAAHQCGVLHRDIKPDNLMLGQDGKVKLLDFGLAKLADVMEDVTVDGTVLGTPHFMSPEQCMGEPLDPRSDVYQMGATLYMLLTGQYPYLAASNVLPTSCTRTATRRCRIQPMSPSISRVRWQTWYACHAQVAKRAV